MGRVTLCKGTTFGSPCFSYQQSVANLEPEIDGQANSLAVFVPGFVITAFYERPNFQGSAIVITNPGSVKDLSQSPWGNWSNRIRSVRVGASLNELLQEFSSDTEQQGYHITVIGQLPDEPTEIDN